MKQIEWTHHEGDRYVIIGYYPPCRADRRFRLVLSSWRHADGINLWRGNVWHMPADPVAAGYKRRLVKRVIN